MFQINLDMFNLPKSSPDRFFLNFMTQMYVVFKYEKSDLRGQMFYLC